ncbi:MAG: hypothetical protein AAGI22_14925 [Planctomycetota bacterium]
MTSHQLDPIRPATRSRSRAGVLRGLSLPAILMTALVAAACTSTLNVPAGTGLTSLQGAPETVAVAREILEPHAVALSEVQMLVATCVRRETIAATGAHRISDGPLFVRRAPATTLFRPSGTRRLQILENETTRLVLDASRRHATRWTYAVNPRAIAGVAAILVDVDFLAQAFVVESAGPFEEEPALQQVTFIPSPDAGLATVERLEIVFDPDEAVPVGLRVMGRDGAVVDYELNTPTLDPVWRNPEARFTLDVPPNFKISEQQG